MKIESLAASVIQPLRRKKKKAPKVPPWASKIPPDQVEVALKARVNRYSRAPLRFNHFGSTRTKYKQRLAIYQDLLDILPDHVPTLEEMQADLAQWTSSQVENQVVDESVVEKASTEKSLTEEKIQQAADEIENQEDLEINESESNVSFTLESLIKDALAS